MSEIDSELVIVSLLWLASLARVHTLRFSATHRALWLAITTLAMSMTLRIDMVAAAIDQYTGVTAAGMLLKHLAGLVAIAALFDLAVLGTGTRLRRTRLPLAVLAMTTFVMAALFSAMNRTSSVDFADHAAGVPAATVYILVWSVYLGGSMASSAWLFHRARATARHPLVRFGQLMLTIGTALGTAYAIYRISYFTLRLFVAEPAAGDEFFVNLSDAAKYLAMVLITTGLFVAGIPGTMAQIRTRQNLRRLESFWQELALPGHKLDWPDLASSDRLARHLVELRDAMLLLRHGIPPKLRDVAAEELSQRGVSKADLDIAVYACLLRYARQCYADRALSEGKLAAQQTEASQCALFTPPSFSSRNSELQWTLQLAAAWSTHPVRE
nr:hypothetical protein [Longispora sp. (in: high G+C Gram-positive bacteria)]